MTIFGLQACPESSELDDVHSKEEKTSPSQEELAKIFTSLNRRWKPEHRQGEAEIGTSDGGGVQVEEIDSLYGGHSRIDALVWNFQRCTMLPASTLERCVP